MLVVRGTKKLRDRVKGPVTADGDVSTTMLGDWFATALFWKPQVALLVNRRTFVPVLMPLAPATTLLDRARDAIAAVLRRLGADDSFLEAELDAMQEARIAPTDDRSVVGVMNEFAINARRRRQRSGGTLDDVAFDLAGIPIKPLRDRNGAPDLELAAALGIQPVERTWSTWTTAASADPASTTSPVYQLKVTLKGTKPPIWRRVVVDASATLDQLHEVIQAAFGSWNSHLYKFDIGRTDYGIPDPDWDIGEAPRDARRTRLDEVAAAGASFTYTYDFGDNWEHRVIVEKLLDTSPVASLPACVDGRRAGPPEDCGGVWGYEELLAIVGDPSHPGHADRAEWVSALGGGAFDPEAFDPGEFADNLRTLRLTRFDDD